MKRIKKCSSLSVFLVLSALIFIFLAGCGTRPPYWKLYSSMQEAVEPDSSVLKGRSIVIDPGHGGTFRGAEGARKLSEADVNLGVALYLWGLLKNTGARVNLTRTVDRDFLPDGSDEVRADLDNRMKLANSFDADLFLSIHHNSSLPVSRGKNGIEIYYRNDISGSSAELARITRLHLDRNLGIEHSVVKPGNYFVLRNSNAGAAILGEASYLSHPAVEDSLKLSSKQRLEAEAYFLAIQHYFSRGVPSISLLSPEADTVKAPPVITYRVRSTAGIDPSSARIIINGKERIPSVDGSKELMYFGIPAHYPNGEYIIQGRARSMKGGTGSTGERRFFISRDPRYFIPLPAAPESGGGYTLSVRIMDRRGNPVLDGSPVTISSLKEETVARSVTSSGLSSFRVNEGSLPGNFVLSAWGISDTLYFEKPENVHGNSIRVINSMTGDPVPFPLAVSYNPEKIMKGDSRGIIPVPAPETGMEAVIFGGGYIPGRVFLPSPEEGAISILAKIDPLFGGVLSGRRIAINPACGGSESGSTAMDSTRESTVNIEVAGLLRDLLRGCGADVLLTRAGEETVSVQERVERANRFDPDLVLSIHHDVVTGGNDNLYSLRHYPGSSRGFRLASLLSAALAAIFPPEGIEVSESAELFLTHTSSPALKIHLNSLSESMAGEILTGRNYKYYIGECIFSAVVRYFADSDSSGFCPLRINTVSGGGQAADISVTVDNLLMLPAGRDGSALFSHIDEGEHLITAYRNGKPVYRKIHIIEGGCRELSIDIE